MSFVICSCPIPHKLKTRFGIHKENAGAAEIELSAAEVAELDRALDGMEMSQVFGGSQIVKK